MLRSKYCEGRCDIDMFKPKGDASNSWRGIIENIDVLKRGVGMAVGNGGGTKFWLHPWATKHPLIDLVTAEAPEEHKQWLVQELWDADVGWKMEMFADYLSARVLQTIEAFELQEDEEAIDKIFWNGERLGGFSVKSALRIIRNEYVQLTGNSACWKKVWRLQLPQRIKFFLWLLFHDRLMTNSNRFLRWITTDPRCFICGSVEENNEHIFRECPSAILVWKKFPWLMIMRFSINPS